MSTVEPNNSPPCHWAQTIVFVVLFRENVVHQPRSGRDTIVLYMCTRVCNDKIR